MTQTVESFPSETLAVPGEPGVYLCDRHRNTQTRLRCGRCERPICPKCTVMGPTGARCRECSSNRTSHMYQVNAGHLAIAFFGCLFVALIAASLARGFLLLALFAPALGTMVGQGIVRLTKGKRGSVLAGAATAGAIVGALWPIVGSYLRLSAVAAGVGAGVPMGALLSSIGFVLLFLVLFIPSLWWWLK